MINFSLTSMLANLVRHWFQNVSININQIFWFSKMNSRRCSNLFNSLNILNINIRLSVLCTLNRRWCALVIRCKRWNITYLMCWCCSFNMTWWSVYIVGSTNKCLFNMRGWYDFSIGRWCSFTIQLSSWA